DNDTRKTGALSYLMYTSAGVSTENAIEGAKFVNAKPVYFPPMQRKWGNDNLNGVAWKASAIHDLDGSVGGIADSYILIHDGVFDNIATDEEACQIKRDWNAAVCTGDVGRLSFGGGGGPRGRGAGPGAGRGGAAGPGAFAGGAGGRGAAPGGAPGGRAITVPAGGFGGGGQPPVILSRNGRDYEVTSTNVRAGTEIQV